LATKVQPAPLARPLYDVAAEIRSDFRYQGKPLYYAAKPYIEAMDGMTDMTDRFYEDSAVSVVTYAVSNLGSWRGEVATRVKAELRAALADAKQKGLKF
jgi:hypothetical protein